MQHQNSIYYLAVLLDSSIVKKSMSILYVGLLYNDIMHSDTQVPTFLKAICTQDLRPQCNPEIS